MDAENNKGISLGKAIVSIGACSYEVTDDDLDEKAKALVYKEIEQALYHKKQAEKILVDFVMTKTVLSVLNKVMEQAKCQNTETAE